MWEERGKRGEKGPREADVPRGLRWESLLQSPPVLMSCEHWNLGMLSRAGARKEV